MPLLTLSSLAFLASAVHAININGVGKLPKLGYDTWNAFQCNYNSSLVLQQAMLMKKHGFVDLGYDIIILDDCYSEPQRNKAGDIVADPTKFPQGMEYFSGQVSDYGVSLAAYSDSGWKTCAGYPGAYGNEERDLKTFLSWGMSYLKYDNCNLPANNISRQNQIGRYQRMTTAIEKLASTTGTTFELGLCEWGVEYPWIWASKVGNAWRIAGDVRPWWSSISGIIELQSYISWASGFYGHNDMDMLEVGNTGIGTPPGNLTYDETKTHFTAWALLKSPLIIGTDLTKASTETLEILGNKDILKINQDPNEEQPVYSLRGPGSWEYWGGNSSYGAVFMLINSQDESQDMFFTLTENYAVRAGIKYRVYDMWTHQHLPDFAITNMTVTVPAHGVSALLLTEAGWDGIEGTCFEVGLCDEYDGQPLPPPLYTPTTNPPFGGVPI